MRASGEAFPFDIDPFRRHLLLNGLDDISQTLEHAAAIDRFEQDRAARWVWLPR